MENTFYGQTVKKIKIFMINYTFKRLVVEAF